MIGIVRLFPTEAFLTREFTLVVWNDKLNNICVRVFLQKKGVVIDEVFAKVVKLCFEAKVSRWEHRVSNFGSSIDCALCDDQGGGCVRKNNIVWVVHGLSAKKNANGKEELFPKKSKNLGSRIMKTEFFVWEFFDDLVIWKNTSMACLDIIMKTGPLQLSN